MYMYAYIHMCVYIYIYIYLYIFESALLQVFSSLEKALTKIFFHMKSVSFSSPHPPFKLSIVM